MGLNDLAAWLKTMKSATRNINEYTCSLMLTERNASRISSADSTMLNFSPGVVVCSSGGARKKESEK